jgi:PPOX class F420-dependent enzyme/OxyR family protein/uncharacterized protein (TIGR02246 family)
MPLDEPHARYLSEQRLGLLATVAPSGAPQNKPVGFRYDAQRGTIDIPGHGMETSAKFRNIALRPEVAFTVDDVPDPKAGPNGVRFVELRGSAEQVELEQPLRPGMSAWVIRVHPRRLVSWNVVGPGMHTADLADAQERGRSAVGLGGEAARRGREAVERQVAELQAGLYDDHAERYNRHFADDVMWGSPYGATVDGYDALHAIHQRFHEAGTHAASRYEIVRVLTPAPDVALAQVRRTALDPQGFSEMALYVLVRRDGSWWLAAGQNTIIDPDRGAIRQTA